MYSCHLNVPLIFFHVSRNVLLFIKLFHSHFLSVVRWGRKKKHNMKTIWFFFIFFFFTKIRYARLSDPFWIYSSGKCYFSTILGSLYYWTVWWNLTVVCTIPSRPLFLSNHIFFLNSHLKTIYYYWLFLFFCVFYIFFFLSSFFYSSDW